MYEENIISDGKQIEEAYSEVDIKKERHKKKKARRKVRKLECKIDCLDALLDEKTKKGRKNKKRGKKKIRKLTKEMKSLRNELEKAKQSEKQARKELKRAKKALALPSEKAWQKGRKIKPSEMMISLEELFVLMNRIASQDRNRTGKKAGDVIDGEGKFLS